MKRGDGTAVAERWLERQEQAPRRWLFALAALLLAQVSSWWSPTPDSLVYLSMARSLAESGRLASFGEPHSGLPPGYPLLLSATFLTGERPFLAISLVQWALAVAVLLGVHRWASRVVPGAALLAAALVVCNVSFWIHLRRPLSEIAFMAAAVWAVEAFHALVAAPTARALVPRVLLAAAALLALVFVREVGVLYAAGFGVSVLRVARARRSVPLVVATVAVAALGALALLAFLAYDRATIGASEARVLGTHLDGFLDRRSSLADEIAEGLRLRVSEVARLLVPGMFKAYGPPGRWLDWNMAIYVPVFLAVALGWLALVGRRSDAYSWTLPFYFAVYALWPFDAGTRYMLPMLPVLVASVWALLETRAPAPRSVLALLLVAHLAVTAGYTVAREIPRARECDRAWPAAADLAAVRTAVPRPVVGREIPECTALMVSFLLDRPVVRQGPPMPVP